ncbi:uncharacterized protein V6R79_001109 [Siganus canaliculatus]
MAFTIDEINRNSHLLPNVTLGYSLYDNCGALVVGFSGALSLASGREKQFLLQRNCSGTPPVLGIVGDSYSTFSIAASNVLSLYRMPIVSYFSTCSCLSNRQRFPSFFRTIPSDAFQVQAMIQILKHFGWTWVGLLVSDDDYGLHVAQSFQSELAQSGEGCLAYSEVLPWDSESNELKRIVQLMKASTARVVMVFAHEFHMIYLMEEVVRQKMTGLQWIVSEALTTAVVLHTPHLMPYLAGTLGIAIRRGEIPGLREFILQTRPDKNEHGTDGNSMVRQFWESTFQCKFDSAQLVEPGGAFCTGLEDVENVDSEILDASNLRPEYNIYKAVYALAHALNDMLQCEPGRGPFSGHRCSSLQTLEPWQLVHYVQKVNFTTTFGDQVSFDENGDALPIYDVMNWHWLPDGRTKVQTVGFRHAMTMAFAVDEINRNSYLLPNVTLGYSLSDNCGALVVGFSGALSLASGREEQFLLQQDCLGTPPVLGIVGDSPSTFTIAAANVLGLFRMPIVSYFSTCSCLSDRQRFPSFFRTIPSDAFQVRAMIQILKHFGWTWVGLLVSDDDYGLHVARSFRSELAQSGEGCLDYSEVLPWDRESNELLRIVQLMKASTARVVMVFAHEFHMIHLMDEVIRQNVTGLQWIASEAWTSSTVLQTPHLMPYLAGTLGIAIRRGEIPGLREFLSEIHPDQYDSNENNMVNQFWEHTFQCRFAPPPADWVEAGGALCTGQEDLKKVETEFLDISNLRPEYNVYKAVYALAYALDNVLKCEPVRGPYSGHSCPTLQTMQPWQLLHYLQHVNFSTSFGDQVSFDENGDALPIYDIVNWRWLPDGRTAVQTVVCKLWRQFHLNEMYKPGDVIVGGLFEVHYSSVFPKWTFTTEPQQPSCKGFDTLGFRQAMTMVYAIDEINKNSSLLPNVTLGYNIYDNCGALIVGFSGALSMASGREEQFLHHSDCLGTPPVIAIVGDSFSTSSIAISNVLGLYKMPIVRAMIQILKHFSWTWVGLLVSDDDYGLHVARSFQSDLAQSGGHCLAYLEILPWNNDPRQLTKTVDVMKKSTAHVVMAFAHEGHMIHLMDEVVRQNVTGLQWIASEAWTASTALQIPRLMPYLDGTLGIAIRRGEIPGLREFLLQTHPEEKGNGDHEYNMVRQFWESTFQCRFDATDLGDPRALCTGQENIENVKPEILDLSNLRPEYNIYKAVYALAYAMHNMLKCEPGSGPFADYSCATLQTLEPWQVVHYLQKVNFTTSFGDQVSFDENGDALPIYDVMNWHWLPDGRTEVQTVGEVKRSAFKGEELTIDEDKIIWSYNYSKLVQYLQQVSFTTPFGDEVSFDENGDALPIYDVMNWLWLPDGKTKVHKRKFHLNAMHKSGDVVLGGLFEVHYTSVFPEQTFTSEPAQPICRGFDTLGFRQAMTMAFAIDEINKNSHLLPNVTLGYSLYDNCGTLVVGVSSALSMASGQEEQFLLQQDCLGTPPVLGIVGDHYSTFSIAISSVLGLFRVPIVSYYATCSCLSDRQRFPSFFRTIPSDAFQVLAMIQILKHFGWTWVGLLVSDDDYGLHVARSFQSELAQSGRGCLAYSKVLPWGNDQSELRQIVDVIKISTARIVMVFAHEIHMIHLIEEVMRQNVTGRQWIVSEALSTAAVLHKPQLMPYLAGTLGIAIRRGEIAGLREFLLKINPDRYPDAKYENSMVRQFWESTFQCKFNPGSVKTGETLCTGQEDLEKVDTEFLDISNIRPEYNVYKAVYALAYALHDMLQCKAGRGPFSGHSCASLLRLGPWQNKFRLNAMHKSGDVVLGGLFQVHTSVFPEQTFTSEPAQPTCEGFDIAGFRQAMTMAFAIDEINKNSRLLPNVTLGYSLYDNCGALVIGLSGALAMASGREEQFLLQQECLGTPPVLGIVGDQYSTFSITMSSVLGLFRMPIVRAVIQILNHFGWTWVGLLVSDDDYGLHVARFFQSELAQSGAGCLAYSEVLPWDNEQSELSRIVDVVKTSTARVVMAFAHDIHLIHLIEEVVRQNVTGRQWITSELVPTIAVLHKPRFRPYLSGTLAIASRRGEIDGLKEFFLQMRPDQNTDVNHENSIVRRFWEITFQCKFDPAAFVGTGEALCTGQEDIEHVETDFLDLSDLRPEYNIYKAVYALVHALDNMLQCEPGKGPFDGHSCASLQELEPWQLVHYLKTINFTTSFGDQVSFDENGDVLPMFDVLNWRWLPDGNTEVETVGEVKSSALSSFASSCKLQSKFHLNAMHKSGDVVLGGLFQVHYTSVFPEQTFMSEPAQPTCEGFDIAGFRQAATMAFAIDEINKNSLLLPNVTLGYSLYDNCGALVIGLSGALAMASGREEQFLLQQDCLGTPPVLGIVGDQYSTFSITMSSVLGLFRMPIVRAMIQILNHFGWTWVGLLVSDDDYGLHVARFFQSELAQSGAGCLAYSEVLPWDNEQSELSRIVDVVKTSTARVVMAFAHDIHLIHLIEEVVRQNVTGRQWITNELVPTIAVLHKPRFRPYLSGTLAIASRRGEIDGLKEFFLQMRPDQNTDVNQENSIVRRFWEITFQCKFDPAAFVGTGEALCTGQEDIEHVETDFLDLSDLRPEYNIYKAVYALVHALDNMLQCEPGKGPFDGHSCASLQELEPWQLVHYLKKINFTTSFGDQVSFDENGDVLPMFDVLNWRWLPDGNTEVETVGEVKSSALSSFASSCKLQSKFHLNAMHKSGNVVLGGLFQVHYTSVFPEQTFTSEPAQPTCEGFDIAGFRQAATMAFAIDEINKNSHLLPNVTLGYSLYDNCGALVIGLSGALAMASGREEQFLLQQDCLGTPPVLGIVGDQYSTFSITMSSVLGLFRMPIVQAMIEILNRFGWTWIGLVVSDDDYGLHLARFFQSELAQSGAGCLAYSEVLPWDNEQSELSRIVDVVKTSTARVVMAFAHDIHLIHLIEEVVRQNVTGQQWITSEMVPTIAVLHEPRFRPYLSGTLAIASRRGEIAGLKEFLLQMRHDQNFDVNHENSIVKQFWEDTFQCKFDPAGSGDTGESLCTGQEDIEHVETDFLDLSDLRPEYNIYKAVYALVYALDDMLQCEPGKGPFNGHSCATLQRLEPWQLVHYLKTTNFTTSLGDQVSFDENGDVLPIFDVINYRWLSDENTEVETVGEVKRSAKGIELTINEEKIFWNFKRNKSKFHLNAMHKSGNVVLGGLFQVHYTSVFPEQTFTSEPAQPTCEGFDIAGFRQAATMAFAIDEINKNSRLLPNVTLGYSLYDNCGALVIGLTGALAMASGREEQFLLQQDCLGTPPVLGIVGDQYSTFSITMSSVLGLFRMPIVQAMIEILKRFGWTWVGLLVSDDDYGLHVARFFQSELAQSGAGCLAYSEVLPWDNEQSELSRIVDVVKTSTARVVMAFAHDIHLIHLIEEVVRQNVTGQQWITSELVPTIAVLHEPRFRPYLSGTLAVASRRGEIAGLKEFLLQMRHDQNFDVNHENSIVKQFWEDTFQCKFDPAGSGDTGESLCTGQEDIEHVETDFLDLSDLRPEYNIYKAVYALVYALDDMLQCEPGKGPFNGHSCATLQRLEPWQLVHYLKTTNFTTSLGDQVSFDENGDVLPIFDVINYRWLSDENTEVETVGEVKRSAKGIELTINEEKIFWNFKRNKSKFHLNAMHKSGNVVLGGLFQVHYTSVFPKQTFTSEPAQPTCEGFDIAGFRQAATMAFAIDEINKNSRLLPNVTLGYSLYDNCGALVIGLSGALAMASGREEQFLLQQDCLGTPPVLGIVGDQYSTFSITMSSVLGLFRMPIVQAMIEILTRFGWTWVGLLVSDDDYGLYVARFFQSELAQSGAGCLAYSEVLPWDNEQSELSRIVDVVKTSTARVVMAFAHDIHLIHLIEEVVRQNVTGQQWITNEFLPTIAVLHKPRFRPYLNGTLAIASRRGEFTGLKEFLLQIRPDQNIDVNHENSMVGHFWETIFQCKFDHSGSGDTGEALCTGQENIEHVETEFLDLSDLRPEYNIYKAVYALVHALDNMLQCEPGKGPFDGHSCATLQKLEPWQLVHYLKTTNFTTSLGDQVSFDENGDVLPIFDVINYRWLFDGNTEVETVGEVKRSAFKGIELTINEEKIFWSFKLNKQRLAPMADEKQQHLKVLDKTAPSSFASSCKLKRKFHLNAMHKSGDVVLGGLFEVHYTSVFPEQTFTSEPAQPTCKGFDIVGFRQAMTMAFAIDEINKNSHLLPNVTLGYSLYDNCGTLVIGVRAVIQILKRFGWTWVGLLVSDDDYGLYVARFFQSELAQSGAGCLAYSEVLPWDNEQSELSRIVDVVKTSTARVVMAFAHDIHLIHLIEEVVIQNVTGRQWIANEVLTTITVLHKPRFRPFLSGTLAIASRRGEIAGLKEFLLQMHPDQNIDVNHENSMVKQFWETTFQCKFDPAGFGDSGEALCTGQEDIQDVETELLDLSDLRPEYNIYKAVYALVYALDSMLQCEPGQGPFIGHSCATVQSLEPWQLLHYLKHVNFTTSFGDQVSFDENGDALPINDVMNWHWLPDGRTKVQTVGEVKRSAFKGEELTIDEDKIFWNFESNKVFLFFQTPFLFIHCMSLVRGIL